MERYNDRGVRGRERPYSDQDSAVLNENGMDARESLYIMRTITSEGVWIVDEDENEDRGATVELLKRLRTVGAKR